MPIALVDRRNFGYSPGIGDAWRHRALFTSCITSCLQDADIDVVAMAGFMTILDASIFGDFGGRILNIHPSLLPAFKGEHAVRDALTAGVKVTGSTIHVATPELDDGPILAQAPVPVRNGDTIEALWERIKQVERVLYPDVLQDILDGTIILNPKGR